MKRKIIYSDVPRPYDKDAERIVKTVGVVLLSCLVLAALALMIGT